MDSDKDDPKHDSSIDETEEDEIIEYANSSDEEITHRLRVINLSDNVLHGTESSDIDYYPGSVEEARAFFNLPRGATSADEIPVAGSVEPVAGPSRGSNPSPVLEVADFVVQDGDMHPLLISGVVTNLFKLLDLKSLKTCRLVNTFWNGEACRALQKIWPATIVGDRGIAKYLRIFGQPNEQRPNPHAIFEFYGIQFDTSTLALDRFFDFYGSCMKSLILQLTTISLTKLMQVLLEDVPELKSLWLRTLPSGPEESPDIRSSRMDRNRPGSASSVDSDDNFSTFSTFRIPKLTSQKAKSLKGPLERISSLNHSANLETGQTTLDRFLSVSPTEVRAVQGTNTALKHLIIGTFYFARTNSASTPAQVQQAHERTAQILQALLSLSPKLEKISLSGLDLGIRAPQSRALINAITRMPPQSLRLLTQLNVPILVEAAVLRGFLNLNSRFLNDMELIFYQSIPRGLVREFFTMIAPTMSKLSLTFASSYFYHYDRNQFFGEHSTNLKELTLRRFRWNLAFLENMPILEKLVLKDVGVGYSFPLNMRKMENMKILRIENEGVITVSPIDDEILARMARAFPSLTQLHFPGATDDCLRVIYSNLPYLTVLECFGGYFTDSGVTGVTMNVCADLAESLNYDRVDGDRLRMDLFIGNLTKIQTLKLESDFIGEMSVIFGINKCFNLVDLYLKSARITNVAARKITECLAGSVLYLDLLDCPLVTQTGLNSWSSDEIARLNNRRLPSAPGPGIDEIARLVRARHVDIAHTHRSSFVEENYVVYACHPLPREFGHRELLSQRNYGEVDIQHLVMPVPVPVAHLMHAQAQPGYVPNAHHQAEVVELLEDLNPIPINLEDNNAEIVNEIVVEGEANPIPAPADPVGFNDANPQDDEV